MKFYYVKRLYFRKVGEIKKFRTKIPDFGTFLYGIYCFGTIYTKAEKDSFPENKVLKDEFSGKSSSFIQVFRPIPTIWRIWDSNDGNFSSLVSKVYHFSIFYGY